jgi:hypothetical protein
MAKQAKRLLPDCDDYVCLPIERLFLRKQSLFFVKHNCGCEDSSLLRQGMEMSGHCLCIDNAYISIT